MKYQIEYNELKNKINNSNKIAIFWHDYVDWDCIGSMLWLGTLLQNMNKSVTYHTSYTPSKKFNRVTNIESIKTDFDYGEYDMVIRIDFNNPDRISKFRSEYFWSQNLYIIDHHPWSKDLWAINIVDTDQSSACEVIRDFLYNEFSDLITANISTYLLYGTMSDTWSFRHEKDSHKTLKTASEMIKFWANKKLITENITTKYNKNYFEFLKVFLDRITEYSGIVYAYVLSSDLDAMETNDIEEFETFRNFIWNYEWAKISIYITEPERGALKFSMRSDLWIVWDIAIKLGWWWHPKAAWFKIKINKNDDIQKIIKDKISEIKILSTIS